MARLFGRKLALTIGDKRFDTPPDPTKPFDPGLRVSFRIDKKPASEPDKAEISIWNLASATRSALSRDSRPTLALQAGYQDEFGMLFYGKAINIKHVKDGPDWVTRFTGLDGPDPTATLNASFPPGTDIPEILRRAAEALGVGVKAALEKIRGENRSFTEAIRELPKGFTAAGPAKDVIDNLMKSMGLQWSVQDGQIVVSEPTGAAVTTRIEIGAASGLVDSPEPALLGRVKFRSLLRPTIKPFNIVSLDAISVKGRVRCDAVTHVGDTYGMQWHTEVDGLIL